MGKSIVFVNQKGGVGKTTSAVNIGAYFAQAGKKTLLVDFDPQGNMSSGVGISKKSPTIYDAIAGKVPIQKTVRPTAVKDLYAIPADINLSGATIELVDQQSREFCTGIVHRKKDTADFKVGIDFFLHSFNGLQQKR